jgi:hypothetical protein
MAKNSRDLFLLFDAVLSETAHEDDIRRLNELLEQDAEALELFVNYTQDSVDLRHILKTSCPYPAPSIVSQKVTPASRNILKRRPSRSTRWIVGLASCAAVVAVSVGYFQFAARSIAPTASTEETESLQVVDVFLRKPPAPVAVLTSEQNAVWQGPKIFAGQSLREGDALTLVRGAARISMGFGAEIAAQGPCALRIISRDRVQLQFGEVAVHVADWAHGFKVETPAMDVVDLGTTFVVSASQDARTETSVIEGQVKVSPRQTVEGNPRSILVSEGEVFVVEKDGQHANVQAARPKGLAFVDFSGEQPFRPVGLHNTGYSFGVGEQDPYWRVTNGPSEAFTGAQYAMVCEPDVRYLANDPSSSQWVSMDNWKVAAANSIYTFQTKFDLTGFDVKTVQLFGRILADNGIAQIRVNGKPVILEAWIDNIPGQQFAHPQFRTVNISQGLVRGINTVEIDVRNGGMQPKASMTLPNPMAVRVEWEGFGRPESSPPARVGRPVSTSVRS